MFDAEYEFDAFDIADIAQNSTAKELLLDWQNNTFIAKPELILWFFTNHSIPFV
ncbi:MAG: hypothetical protein ACLU99_11280 [Alphaproteobacteria bacterium]